MAPITECDVAIVGGGPAGSTAGALLKKYNPSLDVAIFERERFPRDHVGESLLPAIMPILVEMDCWDKMEAANFPIKIGATYRWGASDDLWFLDFVEGKSFDNRPRPERFEGQRRLTTFQVDRSIYDKILLDHAAELGCRVFESTAASNVKCEGDRIVSVAAEGPSGEAIVRARYFVDCSGESGRLRRGLGIGVDAPTALRNIAFWDYWQNAEWAEVYGNGGTHVQIMSLGWGWIWFIPISATRTSIGLVLPADYYKKCGKGPEELYLQAIAEDPRISQLVIGADRENKFSATKDWNFLTERLAGENWFLAGDCCGFADPVLSAGLTLTHAGARKVAYSILELDRGNLPTNWIKEQYSETHRNQIRHHMQFADFWYSSNGHFTDLKEYCAEIARTAGVSFDPDQAFRWLASGGFAIEEPGLARALTYRVAGIKATVFRLSGNAPKWQFSGTNSWRLNLNGARAEQFPHYREGRIEPLDCFRRGAQLLPVAGIYSFLIDIMKTQEASGPIMNQCVQRMVAAGCPQAQAPLLAAEAVEALLNEGWIEGAVVPGRNFVVIG